MRIGYRLAACFTLILVLLIGVGAFSIVSSREARDTLAQIAAESSARTRHIGAMRGHLVRQATLVQQLALSSDFDASSASMKRIDAEAQALAQATREFSMEGLPRREQDLVGELHRYAAQVRHPLAAMRESVEAFNPTQAAQTHAREVAPAQGRWLDTLDELMQLQNARVEQELKEYDRRAHRGDMLIVLACAAAVGLAAAVAWWLARSITQPLRHAVNFAQAVADGQLDAPLPEGSRDETGLLLSALSEMSRRLRLAHEELSRLATEDPLTRAFNRRHFDEVLERELQRLARVAAGGDLRPQDGLALLMLDVDHFKRYNDRFGHPEGDRCLQAVIAAVRRAGLRSSDVVARYGGEEFAVVLPQCSLAGAVAAAERIRAEVAAMQLPSGLDDGSCVTVSIGASVVRAVDAQASTRLIKRTDAALYRAKGSGRNRVEAVDDEAVPVT